MPPKRKSDADSSAPAKKARASTAHASAAALVHTILADPDAFPIPDDAAAVRASFGALAEYARSLEGAGAAAISNAGSSTVRAKTKEELETAAEKIRKAAHSGIRKQMTRCSGSSPARPVPRSAAHERLMPDEACRLTSAGMIWIGTTPWASRVPTSTSAGQTRAILTSAGPMRQAWTSSSAPTVLCASDHYSLQDAGRADSRWQFFRTAAEKGSGQIWASAVVFSRGPNKTPSLDFIPSNRRNIW
ncbi:predicted protein [Postia placenta Mad-698-R]|nr:predicted protein [Postia placenta Mad-698-R]